ncbi:hypothetical protein Cni_G07228 [Canna indica]|uniref:Uncharacterized protein n=1 Tax=Canna indica TaxID=4628 RepID=A0AAQ3K1S6_9LILI|nr:hypothetical protein Cni_G07228 [Canna indica]
MQEDPIKSDLSCIEAYPTAHFLLEDLFLITTSCYMFAKQKLDESIFLGNHLKVSYAPQFESCMDVKEKLEGRRKEVPGRM